MIPETIPGLCGYFFGFGFASGLGLAFTIQLFRVLVSATTCGIGAFDRD